MSTPSPPPADPRPPRTRATLGRDQRVRKTAQFQAAYAARARVGDGRLVAYARLNGSQTTRVGLSVSRRVGGSVVRNRVKRLLREVFRRARAEWPAGYDIVLVPLVADYTLEELDQRVRSLVPAAMRKADAAAKKSSIEPRA